MEEKFDFNSQLGDKLQALSQEIERVTLPGLKNDFQNFTTIFGTLYNVLIKKGLMAEDPYQYEEKISDITPVTDDTFLEGEKSTVMGIRMSNFNSQLAFMNEYFLFSLDHFTLLRLKNVSHFIRFIRWDAFTETSTEINTRCLASIVSRSRKGEDAMTTNILNDNLKQLGVFQNKILEKLKRILLFKREEYKYGMRVTVMPSTGITESEYQRDAESAHRKVKREFASHMKGHPYVPELIKELLEEEFSLQSLSLREDLLKRITVTEEKKETKRAQVNFKALSMECLRALSAAAIPLEGALQKLRNNSLVMEDRILTFGEKVLKFISSMVGSDKKNKLTYTVEMIDQVTSAHRQEDVVFEKFLEECTSRVKILNNLAIKTSPLLVSLSAKSEDEIMDYFDKNFVELAKLTERINALDAFFKTETPKERRSMIKGVKTEIGSLRLALSNSNKAKHEFVSAKEEMEQLKRLGIIT